MEFKLISIASLIAFYGCYFVKMFCQKRQGIQTDQIGKNKIGFTKFVEITMKISAILVFIAELVSIFLETGHSPTVARVIGTIMSVGGTVIFIVAVWTMQDSWRAGVPKTDKTELVTSGIYQRQMKVNHHVYHHILNPHTGYSYDNGLASVTIVSPSSMQGDALSTVCFSLGLEKGKALIESLDDVEACFIDTNNQITYTKNFNHS